MWSNNYIGIPFKYKGRNEDGLDCWGLARLIYKNEYNITLPSFSTEYEDSDAERIAELIAQYKEGWDSIDTPSEGTAVVFRILGHESHIGVAVSNTHFIHAREGYDSAIESFDSPYWRKRIVGHFKYNSNKGVILNTVPHPLRTERYTMPVPAGTKLDILADWILKEYNVAEEIKSKVNILVNGRVIAKSDWSSITLNDSDVVEYRAVPNGGNTTRLILTLAVMYIAFQFGGAVGGQMGFTGATAQAVGSMTISMIGTVAINYIAPIRPPDMGPDPKDAGSAERALMVTGAQNRGTPYQAIPVVLGKVRVTPPLGANNYLTYETERDNYLSMLLVWGYGPLTIYEDTFRIGEQTISNYTDYTLVNLDRKTTETFDDLTKFNAIYGSDITQTNPRLELVCEGNPETTVTAGPWAEAVSTETVHSLTVAIHFPQGLRKVKTKGNGAGDSLKAPVSFDMEYYFNNTWINLGSVTIGADSPKKDAFTYTKTFSVYADDLQLPLYNEGLTFRIRRTTGDNVEDNPDYRYYFQAYLQTVTFSQNAAPASDPNNCKLAKSAFKIKATDQLNGSIEGINAIVQTYAKDWNGSSWVLNSTNNPASLFRYVLEHPANAQKITSTSKLDLVQLQHWHTYCANKGFTFNSVLGSQKSILEVLRDICAAGRASPALIDGKWTVTIDEEKPNVIQHFTPHNSWDFESTKTLPRIPDGLRVTYFDEDQNYQESEIIVYSAGKNSGNSSMFESIQLPGVTKKSAVIDHARWHIAQAKLRPELYTLNTDIEYLVCNRGDRVKVAHDVPMWGVGSGRIKNRVSNVVFDLDEPQTYDSTKEYLIRVRGSNGASTVRNLVTTATVTSYSTSNNYSTVVFDGTGHPFSIGAYVKVTLDTASEHYLDMLVQITDITENSVTYYNIEGDDEVTAATGTLTLADGYITRVKLDDTTTQAEVNSSDLFIFGEIESDSQDLIVLSIEPTTNKSARITLIDYGVTSDYNIFTDYLNLTENTVFESQITLPAKLQLGSFKENQIPVITTLTSNEAVMEKIAAGVFKYNLKVSYSNVSNLPKATDLVQVQYDLASSTDNLNNRLVSADFMQGSITVPDVTEGENYKLRIRYVSAESKVGPWSDWVTTTIVGKTTQPSAVTNFNTEADSTTGRLLLSWDNNSEVDIKGYEVRTEDAEWGSNTNRPFYGSANSCTVPPEDAEHTRTFYIRAFDYGDNYSVSSTSVTFTAPLPNQVTNLSYVYGTTSNTNSTVTFSWDSPVGSLFTVKHYIVKVSKPNVADEILVTASTKFTTSADWLGNAKLSIITVDMANSQSAAAELTVPKYAPNPLVTLDTEVVDNNVLLRWEFPAVTSLPIAQVMIKRGETWETADKIIGTKTGTFTSVFELSGGRYTYWVATVDTDNRESTPLAVSVTVSQPPDFVFNAEYRSTFDSTRVNAAKIVNSSSLLMLVDTSETWAEHFSSNSWANPQAQINAGYGYYALPALSSASYQEVFDYGQVLASSSITVSQLGIAISGTPNVYVQIETSLDNITWTTPQNVTSIFAFNFRYIRVTVVATSSADQNLYMLTHLVVRLDNKQITDAGNMSAVSSDTSGTIVNFNKEFIDIQSINLTAAGTTPITAMYDHKDSVLNGTYNLTNNICTVDINSHGLITGQNVRLAFLTGEATNGVYTITRINDNQYTVILDGVADTSGTLSTYAQSMRVYTFNSTSGTRTSAQVSWQIRGY
jgi:hypothetical protein